MGNFNNFNIFWCVYVCEKFNKIRFIQFRGKKREFQRKMCSPHQMRLGKSFLFAFWFSVGGAMKKDQNTSGKASKTKVRLFASERVRIGNYGYNGLMRCVYIILFGSNLTKNEHSNHYKANLHTINMCVCVCDVFKRLLRFVSSLVVSMAK